MHYNPYNFIKDKKKKKKRTKTSVKNCCNLLSKVGNTIFETIFEKSPAGACPQTP